MKPNEIDESQRMNKLDARGNWQYPSGAESGFVEIELPTLPGSPNAVERLHAKDFGPFVVGKIESSLNRQGYMRSGPQQSPSDVLGHYIAVAKGSKLIQPEAISHMERLAKEFRVEPGADRRRYFETMVKPYLLSLTPQRRRR